MAKGDTKTNQYLDIAANGTRADLPADTCCETRTQALIRGVAERVMDVEDEVEEIKNNPDVVDIVATYAALQAYDTSHLTNDDVIRVLADETHDGQSTYYRWNNPNSGWNYIGTVGDYYTKTQVDALLSGKQNVLTFDNAPTANSTNPVTSEGIKTYVDNKARTFQPYPSTVNTTGTTQQFISSVQALNAPAGTAYLGTVELTDLPASLIQEEVQVYVYDNNLIYCIMYSADAAPYVWWCNSYDYRGWEAMSAIYTAGSNVQISNNNVISATDTTYSNFTGTDGTAAGTAGLVPAPATTDAGKFLKADGTWDDAAGSTYTAGDGIDITNDVIKATNTGKARVLTTDDYNYPVDTPTLFAWWLLPAGAYEVPEGSQYRLQPIGSALKGPATLYIGEANLSNSGVTKAKILYPDANYTYNMAFAVFVATGINTTTGAARVTEYKVPTLYDGLDASFSNWKALDAYQGKVLKDLVDSLAFKNAGAPTTSTVGTVGQLLEDTTNGKLYICTDATNPYVWEEVGAGGSGPTVVQTTGTSQSDVMSQNAVTSMVFADPATQYKIKIGAGTSSSEGSNGVEIGHNSQATGLASVALGYQAVATKTNSVAIGQGASVGYANSVAIGKDATPTRAGEVNIGSGSSQNGFNNSGYRVLGGLYDGQSAHDAVNKEQLDTAIINGGTTAPTTATVGAVGTLYNYVDTTGAPTPHMMVCTAVTAQGTTPETYTYTWTETGGGGSSVSTVNNADWSNLWQ